MSDAAETVKLDAVVRAELAQIQERRRQAGLSAHEPEKDLVGVALSGGGLRASGFGLGVVQALYKSGLWRFVDYLSTVSGGGFLGGLLSSHVIKRGEVANSNNCPLLPGERGQQPAEVQRQIYGGNRLLHTAELVNRYLIGVLLLNLSFFSGIIAISACVAFAWRSFDYPEFRDRAGLLDLNSDLLAPFIPAAFFGVGWFGAWLISKSRRGAEATGKIANWFLFLMLGSLLAGLALLLGNGDISVSGLDALFGRKSLEVSSGWGASIAGLVAGGLLPFLNPKRLIESGLRSNKKWYEKYIFALSSTAMLIGLPLVLIGYFAQENISGYNTHPHRELIKEDIESWPALTALIIPYEEENLAPNQSTTVAALREAIANLDREYAEGPQMPIRLVAGFVDAKSWRWKLPHPIHVALAKIHVPAAVSGGPEKKKERKQEWLTRRLEAILGDASFPLGDETDFQSLQSHAIEDLQQDPAGKRFTWITELSQDDPFRYLCCLALALDRSNQMQRYDEAEIHDLGNWHYGTGQAIHFQARRFLRVLMWAGGLVNEEDDNEVATYWQEKVGAENLQDQICAILNKSVLSGSVLVERLASPNVAARVKDTPRFAALVNRAQETEAATWLNFEREELNRYLLEDSLSDVFRNRNKIRRRVCIYEDQYARMRYAIIGFLVFVVMGFVVNVNTTSMHRYYRNRLELAFLAPHEPSNRSWLLSELETTSFGAPYHMICASVGVLSKLGRAPAAQQRAAADPNAASLHQRVVPFLFTQRYCGSEITEYLETKQFESQGLDLADAVALSGAAVSPSRLNNWLISFLMFTLNFRLGQWLPNPRRPRARWWPSVLTLLGSLRKQPEERSYVFVNDGGNSDNIGLLALLDRRCSLIVVVDASYDLQHEFRDLGRALRTARVHDGIRFVELGDTLSTTESPAQFDLRTSPLQLTRPDGKDSPGICQRHFLLARILYPKQDGEEQPKEGLLVYLKPCLTGDESLDLIQYRAKSNDFPHESSNDQLFDEDQVESYRQLGYHIGTQLCQLLPPVCAGENLWTIHEPVDTQQLRDWFTGREGRRATTPETPSEVAFAGHFQTVSEGTEPPAASSMPVPVIETEYGLDATVDAAPSTLLATDHDPETAVEDHRAEPPPLESGRPRKPK